MTEGTLRFYIVKSNELTTIVAAHNEAESMRVFRQTFGDVALECSSLCLPCNPSIVKMAERTKSRSEPFVANNNIITWL